MVIAPQQPWLTWWHIVSSVQGTVEVVVRPSRTTVTSRSNAVLVRAPTIQKPSGLILASAVVPSGSVQVIAEAPGR